MKIVTIVGARPQFIKAAMGSRQLRKDHQEILVHTGQHFDENMSDVFFKEMGIPMPDYNLGISGGTHAQMTSKMLSSIEEILMKEKPDALLVYGDTNSTLAAALAAVKIHIPVLHVEAGNRLGSLDNPEEVNRTLTDHCSTLLFCATEDAREKLVKENLGDKSYCIGNIMYDAFKYYSSKDITPNNIVNFEGNKVSIPSTYYYMTCHRQENTYNEDVVSEILTAMNSLDAPTIYPVHPRNQSMVLKVCADNHYDNIILVKPVGYLESVYLTNHAKKIVTDSGGLQCEAFYAGVQCVFVFDKVIWPETMVGQRNQLARPHSRDILEKLSANQVVDQNYQPFGDGHAAEKMCDIISKWNVARSQRCSV